jgi:hypothetical protein
MKVKSNKEVNIRAFEPYRKSNNLKGILKPGFEIEVEPVDGEEITDGEGVNQIRSKKWYKDKNGDFYWSGGFENFKTDNSQSNDRDNQPQTNISVNQINKIYRFENYFSEPNNSLLKNFNLNQLLDVDDSIKANEGEGISIGIMDHPFENLNNIFQTRITHLLNGGVVQSFHGIQMASLIGAYDPISPVYKSLCPKCNIISLPVVIGGKKNNQFFINIINKITENYQPFQWIINASLSIKSIGIDTLRPSFSQLSENFIVIAAAGQDNELLEDKEIQWPASLKSVISVGTISQKFKDNNPRPLFNNNLDVLLPENTYPAFNYKITNKYKSVKGDSSATAIISGLTALLIRKNGVLTKNSVVEKILEQSVSYKDSDLTIIKPINPKT